MAMQSPYSSSFSYDFSFDVFISFRGTDTRFGFTGNLCKALCNKGIHTFIDNEELRRGDEITPSLLKSIEDSRIAIIVFSKNYASSSFCLDELAHIIHHFKENNRLVLPVFYDVDPTDVRHQSGSYGEALAKHNKKGMNRFQKWNEALSQAANLSGHHIKLGTEYEYKSIEKIVKDVFNKINPIPLHVPDYLVGLEPRILEVNSLLELGNNDGVCIIGILGTGGIGKTTLARTVFNSIAKQFEGSCFLPKVRQTSIAQLQEQLLSKTIGLNITIGDIFEGIQLIRRRLSQKKILLILDDVDKLEQLQSFVPNMLGSGSKVIVTTGDKHLLSSHEINKIYEADGLNKEQALELLRNVAFKSKKNDSSYDFILHRATKYASGLPLALELVGSNLSGRSVEECESLLDKYERIPHKNILKTLKVSFDALEDDPKSIFLDIVCFFKGCNLAFIKEELQSLYNHDIKIDLTVLVEKSLIKIDLEYHNGPELRLHDLIEDMGKEIVRQESPNNPGERSRLWFCDDIVKVLQEDMGTAHIKMIYLKSPIYPASKNVIEWNGNAFKKMTNLKSLVIESVDFSKDPEYLPSGLRVLRWENYPSMCASSLIWNKANIRPYNYKKWFLEDIQDNDKMNSSENVVLSKVEYLDLSRGRISDECLQMLLNWCLPEFLRECHHLRKLYLDNCEFLEEIRGFPPNLEEFSALEYNSLSSSSIRMLLSEEVHEKLHKAGYKKFRLQTGTEGIPDWFEHQSRGHRTISFRFRKKIPSINVIILQESEYSFFHKVKFYVNDCRRDLPEGIIKWLPQKHAVLFDLKLEEVNLENEWITVMLKLENDYFYEKDMNVEMGIHVWKEKNNMEEDVIFTNTCRKRKLWKRKQHLAALVSDMRNLVLTETEEEKHHD